MKMYSKNPNHTNAKRHSEHSEESLSLASQTLPLRLRSGLKAFSAQGDSFEMIYKDLNQRLTIVIALAVCLLVVTVCLGGSCVSEKGAGLMDTSASPYVKLRSVGIGDVRWTKGFWADRFDVCHKVMIPNMWQLLKDSNISRAYDNFLVAAGMKEGRHRGPKWHDGDFYKWLEAVAFVYGVTQDKALDEQMDRIIEATGKTSLLVIARKAADYLYGVYKQSPQTLANNAICPSHYMGVIEMFRTVHDPRY